MEILTLCSKMQIPFALAEVLRPLIKSQQLKKHSHFFTKGQPCTRIWYIESGIARWHHPIYGSEVTTRLSQAGDLIFSIPGIESGMESDETVQALEDCDTVYIEYRDLLPLLRKYPELQELKAKVIYMQQQSMTAYAEVLRLDAEDRYMYLEKQFGSIINTENIPHIASLGNMSLTTFYKIRNKRIRRHEKLQWR